MEVVTELGHHSQIISSIRTQERVRLFICFGLRSVGGKKGKRMGCVQHKSKLDFLGSVLFPPQPRDHIPRVTAVLPLQRRMRKNASGWHQCLWWGSLLLAIKTNESARCKRPLPSDCLSHFGGREESNVLLQRTREPALSKACQLGGLQDSQESKGTNKMYVCIKLNLLFKKKSYR